MKYEQVLKHWGSQAEIARKLGLRQPSVWGWQAKGIPALRQLQIERLTEGALRADKEVRAKFGDPQREAA